MLIFPGMLIDPARRAGMAVPDNPDNFEASQYPHFTVFCNYQLGRSMLPGDHWENAKVIANLALDKVTTITYKELEDMVYGQSNYPTEA